jgi:hypothetical protein
MTGQEGIDFDGDYVMSLFVIGSGHCPLRASLPMNSEPALPV